MKLWVDDIKPAPYGYLWAKSVNDAKIFIIMSEASMSGFAACEVIDIDHDAGDYVCDGGDYINFLKWLEETGRSCKIHIHSTDPEGIQNIRAIIKANNWKEV